MQFIHLLEIKHVLDALHSKNRKVNSPKKALLSVTEDEREVLDSYVITLVVLFDFRK